jgi:hypothetical protein
MRSVVGQLWKTRPAVRKLGKQPARFRKLRADAYRRTKATSVTIAAAETTFTPIEKEMLAVATLARRRYRRLLITTVVRIPTVLLQPTPKPPAVPIGACFLLDLFLAKADRDSIPGDLEEEFTTSILPRYGARRARFWFWKQTICTVAIRNPICRRLLVGAWLRFGEWIFRKFGS